MSTVLFLQNAWSGAYAGEEWPRPSWLWALARCRSGQRLRLMIDDFECCHNTTPICGATPSSIVPPDPGHIEAILAREAPSVVVACGRQAEEAVAPLWGGHILVVPHPASRLLTDNLYRRARRMLAKGFAGRVALRQGRGKVFVESLASSLAEK